MPGVTELIAHSRSRENHPAGVLTSLRPSGPALLEAACVLALVIATLIFWSSNVTPPEGGRQPLTFHASDMFLYFLPAYSYQATRIRQLALPMWNPYQGTGQPFLATLQPGALYPARLLLLATDAAEAMRLSTIGHLLLYVLGTYALCRQLGARRLAAMTGGVAFAAAFALPDMYWPPYLEAGAWLPIAALALVRIASSSGLGWYILLGVSAAMPVLAGGYQTQVYFVYGLLIFAVAVVVEPRRRGNLGSLSTLGYLALAGLLAMATAAPQLLTTLHWTSETVRRTTGLTDVQLDPYNSPPTLIIREFFNRGTGFKPAFLSIPIVALALVGFVANRSFGAVIGVAAVGLFLISLGPHGPWFAPYRWLPGLAMFRFPRRLFYLVSFFCSIGAALGVTALGRLPGVRRAAPVRILLEGIALAATVLVLALPFRNRADFPWTAAPSYMNGYPRFYDTLRAINADGRSAVPCDHLTVSQAARQGMIQRIPMVMDYEPLSSRRLGTFLRAVVGLPPPDDNDLWPFLGCVPLPGRIARPDLLDLVATRALVLPVMSAPPERSPSFVPAAVFPWHVIFRNPAALPRAYTVSHAQFVPDESAALSGILAQEFKGYREAVVVGTPDGQLTEALASGPPDPLRRAEIAVDQPERVAVDFQVTRPALLVLADAFAPGWSVTVDGQPRRLWQVNYLLRGVVVGPGEHRAEFSYSAPGIVPGHALAATAWSAVLMVVARRGLRSHIVRGLRRFRRPEGQTAS